METFGNMERKEKRVALAAVRKETIGHVEAGDAQNLRLIDGVNSFFHLQINKL